jgi:hypothetical protein
LALRLKERSFCALIELTVILRRGDSSVRDFPSIPLAALSLRAADHALSRGEIYLRDRGEGKSIALNSSVCASFRHLPRTQPHFPRSAMMIRHKRLKKICLRFVCSTKGVKVIGGDFLGKKLLKMFFFCP